MSVGLPARQVLVDDLLDIEGRHDVQRQAGHDPEGAEPDDGAAEPVAVSRAQYGN
jgi:hypothetical protein